MRTLVLRFPLPTSRRSRYFLISGGLHVVFAVVLILSPLFRPAPTMIDSPLVVDVVGSIPSPARAASRPEPAKPEPEPEPPPPTEPAEGVRAAAEDVPAKPEPEEPEEKPDPKPAPPKPVTPPPETSPAGSVGNEAVGGAITSVGLGEMEHAWYRDSVVAALQSRWVRPVLERGEQDWAVTVAFEITRDGTARNPRIEVPSGVASLDRSALRAVADASPFPPLPSSWREPTVTAQIVFRLNPGE